METKLVFESDALAKKAVEYILDWGRVQTLHINERVNIEYENKQTIIPRLPARLERKFWNMCWRNSKWSHRSTLLHQLPHNNLRQLWPSGLFSDVTLKVEDSLFKVHRAILAARSDYFKALFTHSNENTIELQTVSAVLFKELIDLFYGYSVKFVGLNGIRILILAKQYLLGLSEEEEFSIVTHIKIKEDEFETFLELFEELYHERCPYWADEYIFTRLMNSYTQSLEELFPKLPIKLQELFENMYGPIDEVLERESTPYLIR